MFRITRQTDYGIVLLSRFATEPVGTLHNARDLAKDFGIPLPMVGKILKLLSKNNLLTSIRGAKGGYSLARPAEKITVLEIIAVLEGEVAMTECSHEPVVGICQQESLCPVSGNWQKINRAVRGALSHLTLADMSRPRTGPTKFVQPSLEGFPR